MNLVPFLFRWAILTIAVFVSAHLGFLGITYDSFGSILAVALILGVFNTLVKPVLLLITMPFIFLSFGLFILLINAVLFKLSAALVTGFHVPSFGSAFGGALVVSLFSFLLGTDRRTTIVHQTVRARGPGPSGPRGGNPPPGKGPIIDVQDEG